jgi:catechol 2,3-dioxygenase-like lactoylglutathione lyase family enzyme
MSGCSATNDNKPHHPEAAVLPSDAATPGIADAASNGRADASMPKYRDVCSGCPSEKLDRTDNQVRFHHLHLNVTDPEATAAFYTKVFAAQSVRLNDKVDALWLSPMLFLLHKVAAAPNDTLEMGLDHVGRGSDDVTQWFDQASKQGVMGDPRQGFQSTPAQIGSTTFVYVRGPNAERMEVYSSGTVTVPGHSDAVTTFQHAHFLTVDVDATVAWYAMLLGQPANPSNGLGRDVPVDRVALFFASYPAVSTFVPTDDRPLGHVAFSVTDLMAMRSRVTEQGIEVVHEPAVAEEGFLSFYVRGPEKVLIEFVEAGPLESP